MKSNLILATATVMILSGCVTAPPQPVNTQAEIPASLFNVDEVKHIKTKGTHKVEGNAFLRQGGGGVVTCAGRQVTLIPVSEYASKRMDFIYRSRDSGIMNFRYNFVTPVTHPTPQFVEYTRATTCDSQGNFVFNSVPNGAYYITTTVGWMVGNQPQGGHIMKRVVLDESHTGDRIIMTGN